MAQQYVRMVSLMGSTPALVIPFASSVIIVLHVLDASEPLAVLSMCIMLFVFFW